MESGDIPGSSSALILRPRAYPTLETAPDPGDADSWVRGFKIFEHPFTCKGLRYALDAENVHEGPLELGRSGFHFCVHPVRCHEHYPLAVPAPIVVGETSIERGNDSDADADAYAGADFAAEEDADTESSTVDGTRRETGESADPDDASAALSEAAGEKGRRGVERGERTRVLTVRDGHAAGEDAPERFRLETKEGRGRARRCDRMGYDYAEVAATGSVLRDASGEVLVTDGLRIVRVLRTEEWAALCTGRFISRDGCREHFDRGRLHRDDGPAVVRPGVIEIWYRHGLVHRDGGPAVRCADGTSKWYRDGKLHRADGPAVVWADARTEFWFDGQRKPSSRMIEEAASRVLGPVATGCALY